MIRRPDEEMRPIELRGFLGVMRRRKWLVVSVAASVVAVALAVTAVMSPRYTSTAQVEVRPMTLDEQVQSVTSIAFVNMETEAARVTQEQVAARAAVDLGTDPVSPAALRREIEGIEVSIRPNTTYLDIACSRPAPAEARDCARAFARAYVEDRTEQAALLYEAQLEERTQRITDAKATLSELGDELAQALPGEESDIEQEILDQIQAIATALTSLASVPAPSPQPAVLSRSAELPEGPSNKSFLVVFGLAALLGSLLGIGLALLRERLAEPVTDRESFGDALVAPVLAVVPDAAHWPHGTQLGASVLSMPGGAASEAYRIARTTLQHVSRTDGLKVFAVAGLDGGADATKTTAELAIALAQAGKHVAAVSGNLRTPGLNRLLGVGGSIGLASVLLGEADLDEALLPSSAEGLEVIASGLSTSLPPELLDSDQMRGLVDQLRSAFDFVLLDTAPQPWAADTLSLVPLMDGVIVTAVSGRTLREDITRLRHLVDGVGGRIVGGILKERTARGGEVPRSREGLATRSDDAPGGSPRTEELPEATRAGAEDADAPRRVSDAAAG